MLCSCAEKDRNQLPANRGFGDRTMVINEQDSLSVGNTYLSVYSQIYSYSENITHDLTATVSLRNTSIHDSIYVLSANYYDTFGSLLKNYVSTPIFIKPLETIHIVINEEDKDGGTGANFLFKWATKETTPEPLFEAVMISTSGSQGLSFTTLGKRIY
ncbi:DUF3124 domain-containing protein [Flagellimonas hymeniacidonis]|uniref:DUF3124 domain-containing protein n=2 Tax=Flagellimonas hymeniacidonis TaxID=2603628 RepID=A0A5C8V4G3_9FLAO|nr:DUF3124 domain-containing protein [Flagellimonas hymeniacidonis]